MRLFSFGDVCSAINMYLTSLPHGTVSVQRHRLFFFFLSPPYPPLLKDVIVLVVKWKLLTADGSMEVSGECYGKPCTRVPLVLRYSQKCESKQGHPPSVCLFFMCVHRHFSHKAPDAQKLLNVDVTLSPKCFPSSISIPVAVVWFSNATKAGLATCWHCPCGEELNEAQCPITGSAFPWCPHFFSLSTFWSCS